MTQFIIVQVMTLGLLLGCAAKKVKDQDNQTQPAISDAPIGQDSEGSDGGKIAGLGSIHFPYDSSELTVNDRQVLAGNATWIKAHGKMKVQIEGHCDDRGSVEYNLALGDRRAKIAYKYLVDLGVSPGQLATISYGKEKPLSTEDTDEARAKNRRDNFVPNLVTKLP